MTGASPLSDPTDAEAIEAEVGERVEATLEEERRTSYLELFFDLVFVFAITQVTSLILSDTSAAGFAKSLLVLGLIWWAWSGFAWMTNTIDVEDLVTRVAVLVAMAAVFMVALTIPDAYGDDGVWFGSAYLAVLVLNVALYVRGTKGDPELLRSVLRLAPFFLAGPACVLIGGFLEHDARVALWILGIAVNMAGALDAGGRTWRVSASHFAERHALFVIIALGESIVAIGVGAAEAKRDLVLAGAILAALAGSFVLWWTYFEWTARAVERALHRRTDPRERGRVARDIFTFGHFPMIAGIVLFAVGAKKAVGHGDEPLSSAGRFALGAGIAVYLLAMAAGRYRLIRSVAWERVGAAAAVALIAWLAGELAAAALLAVVTAVVALAVVAEAVRLREMRARIRDA